MSDAEHAIMMLDMARKDLRAIEGMKDANIFSDEIKKLGHLQNKIKKEIESVLSIGVKVTLVEPKTIERSMGKSRRIIDKRAL